MWSLYSDFSICRPWELTERLPFLYYSYGNIEESLSRTLTSPAETKLICTNLIFLDSLDAVPFSEIWRAARQQVSNKSLYTFQVVCCEFESASIEGKVDLTIRLFLHLTEHLPNPSCVANNCCELIESNVICDELVAIFAAVSSYGLCASILPRFISGYIVHARRLNRLFLLHLLKNFPCEWSNVWRQMIRMNEVLSHSSENLSNMRLLQLLCDSNTDQIHTDFDLVEYQLITSRIGVMIQILLEMNSLQMGMVLEYCISAHCFPELTMNLILKMDEAGEMSYLDFLKLVLLDGGTEKRAWFTSYLKEHIASERLCADLSDRLVATAVSLFPREQNASLCDGRIVKALTFLRVLTALRGFVNYNFPPELSRLLVSLLTHPTVASERASHYTSYALAFLIGLRHSLLAVPPEPSPNHRIAISGYLHQQSTDLETVIINWLRRITENNSLSTEDDSQDSCNSGLHDASSTPLSTLLSLVLLLAILFHTNQPGAITDLISNLLGLRIPSLGRTVNSWRKIFLQSVFTESMIVKHIARVPITPNLSSAHSNHLPIQCILHLLKSPSFAKNRLQVKEWIVSQLRQSVRPMHPLLPDLIETHIDRHLSSSSSAVACPGTASEASLGLVTEAELLHQFSAGAGLLTASRLCAIGAVRLESMEEVVEQVAEADRDLTPPLLFLYYALLVHDRQVALRLLTNWKSSSPKSTASFVYSQDIWDRIPVTYLLRYARDNLSDYSGFYPRLLQLITNHLPYLTVGELTIQDELLLDPVWRSQHDLYSGKSSALPTASPLPGDLGACLPGDLDTCLPSPSDLDQAFESVLDHFSDSAATLAAHATSSEEAEHRLIRLVHRIWQMAGQRSDLLLPYADIIAHQVPRLLLVSTVQGGGRGLLYRTNRRFANCLEHLWRQLHLAMPRRLAVITSSSLVTPLVEPRKSFLKKSDKQLTWIDLCVDPVENLLIRVHQAAFRCPQVLRILLRILDSCLLASRSHWTHRLLDRASSPSSAEGHQSADGGEARPPPPAPPSTPGNSPVPGSSASVEATSCITTTTGGVAAPTTDDDHVLCHQLCANMLLTQNATVVQLLLEHCLPTLSDDSDAEEDDGQAIALTCGSELSVLREVRSIIGTYLHYMFIAEPGLVDVIVCQTFPRALLPVSTQAIASLHISLDNVVNVFRLSGTYAKMVFCLDLVSHLSGHYNIQAALDRAAFMVDALHHWLTAVVSTEERASLLDACLPALLRLSKAFPSLAPIIARLLLVTGVLIANELPRHSLYRLAADTETKYPPSEARHYKQSVIQRGEDCLQRTLWTYDQLVRKCSALRNLYYPPDLSLPS